MFIDIDLIQPGSRSSCTLDEDQGVHENVSKVINNAANIGPIAHKRIYLKCFITCIIIFFQPEHILQMYNMRRGCLSVNLECCLLSPCQFPTHCVEDWASELMPHFALIYNNSNLSPSNNPISLNLRWGITSSAINDKVMKGAPSVEPRALALWSRAV